MTSLRHAIIWIDHAQARVIQFDSDTSATEVIRAEQGTPHLHHKANSIDAGHMAENQSYLHAVGRAVSEVESVLVTGPANERAELIKHITRHDRQLLNKVAEVKTVDHPTDGQLLDFARRHFRMRE